MLLLSNITSYCLFMVNLILTLEKQNKRVTSKSCYLRLESKSHHPLAKGKGKANKQMTLVVKCMILPCTEYIRSPTLSSILPFNYQPRSYGILSMTHFPDKKNEVQSDELTSSRPYCYELAKLS